ncbi:MAG: phosphate acetyltransferase [Acidiferrobacteraceae bacterium]|nr:phosphate acetyltransferase [Acidiferrobacteraceae bacterium]
MNQLPENIIARARASNALIVLPEGDDIRVIRAAADATTSGIAEIVILGDVDIIRARATQQNIELEGVTIINPETSSRINRYAELLIKTRTKSQLSENTAIQQASQSIVYANCMVAMGDAHACIAGAATPTAEVIRHAIRIVGQRPDCNVVSSFFLMLFGNSANGIQGPVLFADCGLVVNPDEHELANIAANTACNAELILDEPASVAMLSFSTLGSARHPHVSKVRKATKILEKEYPNISVVGEIQLDAAISSEIFRAKTGSAMHYKKPNVFVFPSLDAGNIAYKLAERTSNATAIGPIMQGLNYPVSDLSRGCSSEDILQNIAVTACQVLLRNNPS